MDKINLLIGTAGIVAANIPAYIEVLPHIVSIICSTVIALSTCALQIYRMWKNRDKNKKPEITTDNEPEKEDGENN